jgi:hypothetical protein
MAARSNQRTPALYKHGYKVALAPYDLGDPKVEIDVGGKDNSDVTRRQSCQPCLLCLYEEVNKRFSPEGRNICTLMQRDCIRRRQACCPVGKTTKRRPSRPSACRTDSWPKAVGTMVAGPKLGACTTLMVMMVVVVTVVVVMVVVVRVLVLVRVTELTLQEQQ